MNPFRLHRAKVWSFELPLHRPLATAHGPIARRRGFLIAVEDEAGCLGYGEATPLPEFGTEDETACRRAIEGALEAWTASEAPPLPIGSDTHDGVVSLDAADAADALSPAPCAEFGLETAFLDLAARRAGDPLFRSIREDVGFEDESGYGDEAKALVRVQALVSGDTPEEVASHGQALLAEGHRAFKVKIAAGQAAHDVSRDRDRVLALREVVGNDAIIRLDANEAWSSAPEAEKALSALADLAIDFVEQPIGRDDVAGLARLRESCAIAVAADEALQGDGFLAVRAAGAAAIWVLKPAALGGLRRAAVVARRAREDGLRVVWSTLIDGAVARAAARSLAIALGPVGEVHGLGTGSLLASDLSTDRERIVEGRIANGPAAGIGFDPVLPGGVSDPLYEFAR